MNIGHFQSAMSSKYIYEGAIAIKKRLTFGVIIAEAEHILQKRIIKGIIAQAQAQDIDLCIFSMTSNYINANAHQSAELNLYQYMNFNLLDGILYARATIAGDHAKQYIDQLLLTQKKPVLTMDDNTSPFPCYMLDDKTGIAELTAHCIEIHGLTDLICLTGYQNNYHAQQRAEGFCEAMQAHGLPCDPERIIYGDFWEERARALGEEIANGTRPMPQGVICTNDTMAKFLCEELTERGISVPEQITVVGYDAALIHEQNIISITSYVRKNFSMGAAAVLQLHQQLTGKMGKLVETEKITLITGRSCACGDDDGYLRHVLRTKEETERYDLLFRFSNMTTNMTLHATLDDCMEELLRYLFLLRNQKEYYLCLNEDWEGDGAVGRQDDYRREGFPEHMILKIGGYQVLSKPFQASKMLPVLHEPHEKPITYFFSPLHHNDRLFGISVVGMGDATDCYDPVYLLWKTAVEIGLEYVRIQSYLRRFNNRIYLSEIRDSLTGLFNAEGHEKFCKECFAAAKKEQRRFLILYAQCDGVRQLNDTYGHTEGDSAITVLANAINNCCSSNERCARIQDGLFSIIGYRDYAIEADAMLIQSIRNSLEQYNQTSLKPYKVTASFGVFCDYLKPEDTLEQISDIAKDQLQENKKSADVKRNAPYYRQFVDLRERIYSNPNEEWNIDKMCQSMILSRGYFQKLYSRCFGISFTQDVINSRISLSKRLLASTDMSIADISESCGYASYVHFMHQFKKVVGITATDYRKKEQAK